MDRKKVEQAVSAARAGFTLIEIMVAIMIIGMLAAVAVPAYMNQLESARVETTRTIIKNIEDACHMYNMKHGGKYPSQLSELQEGDDDNPPILDGEIVDPWGNEIKYEKKGKRIYLTSFGPDGEEGTEDDITNVKAKSSSGN